MAPEPIEATLTRMEALLEDVVNAATKAEGDRIIRDIRALAHSLPTMDGNTRGKLESAISMAKDGSGRVGWDQKEDRRMFVHQDWSMFKTLLLHSRHPA
jgi:hypothetical protein